MDYVVIPYAIAAYLIGGIPFAYIAGKRARGLDIRTSGNGNVGAVNAFKSLGWRVGTLVLVADAAKGAIAVLIALALDLPEWGLFTGALAATIGHNWSPYLRFDGGKGVAIVFGISLALMPLLAWFAAPFVFVTYYFTRSWVWAFGAGILALNGIIIATGAPAVDIALCVVLSVIVVGTHFGREAGEIRKALAAGDWRKVGQLE